MNLALRGSTLLAKFLLIFLLAYFLEPVEVALYGLVTVTVAYALYGLGFDFYAFSTRELLGHDQHEWARLLRDQSFFFALVYVVILPLLSLVFLFDLLPWSIAPWFFALVVLEHLAQELNRVLIAISRQLLASTVLFLRSGFWAIIVVVVFQIWPEARSLDVVFAAWACGAFMACCIGLTSLLGLDRECLKQQVDWKWIKRGIGVALPLLVATLAARGLFTIDRYWVQEVAGVDVLAAYVLFAGVANAVMSFLDAGVFVFLYPKIISAFKEKDRANFDRGMRTLLIQTLWVTLVLVGAAGVFIHPLLLWLDKPAYLGNVEVLYFLLLSIALNAFSMVPHYGIYAMSRDRHIIFSHVIAFLAFVMLAYILTQWSKIYGVPMALCGAFGVMLVYKTLAYSKVRGRQKWTLAESTVSARKKVDRNKNV